MDSYQPLGARHLGYGNNTMLFMYLQAMCMVCTSPKAPAAGHASTRPRSRGLPAVPGPSHTWLGWVEPESWQPCASAPLLRASRASTLAAFEQHQRLGSPSYLWGNCWSLGARQEESSGLLGPALGLHQEGFVLFFCQKSEFAPTNPPVQ